MRPPTTAEIQVTRAFQLQENACIRCVDWALDRLLAGDDSQPIKRLAGLSPPFDLLEIAQVRDDALRLIGALIPPDQALANYTRETILSLLSAQTPFDFVDPLRELVAIYYHQDRRADLFPFTELCAACADFTNPEFKNLMESGNSPGITRETVASLCHHEAARWLAAHPIDED